MDARVVQVREGWEDELALTCSLDLSQAGPMDDAAIAEALGLPPGSGHVVADIAERAMAKLRQSAQVQQLWDAGVKA